MTVSELGERMTSDEFTAWRAFYAYRAALQKNEAAKAERESKGKRGR